jgi:undecaprenyl-diphosphatase
MSKLRQRTRWTDRISMRLLLGLGTIGALIWVFQKIWSEVVEGETHGLDTQLLLALRQPGHPDIPIGPPWLQGMMVDLTTLGGGLMLTLLVLGATGYLLLKRAPWRAALLVAATLSGTLCVSGLKTVFGRARPNVVEHLVSVQSLSFPSGHAANATLVYLTIAALAIDAESDRAVRVYTLAVAILLSIAIGISRIYLGVHWPSDVAGGWAFGAAWALGWRLVAQQFSSMRRGGGL